MSGASFSTPSPSLSIPVVYVPTPRHYKYAKRCLYRFVTQQLDKYDDVASSKSSSVFTLFPEESFLVSLYFPFEVFLLILRFSSPSVHSKISSTCRLLNKICDSSDYWIPQNKQKLENLERLGFYLSVSSSKLASARTYVVLCKYSHVIAEILRLLGEMKGQLNTVVTVRDKETVEELFSTKLMIRSPWVGLNKGCDVSTEMAVSNSDQKNVRWKVSQNIVAFELVIGDGFYGGSVLHFHIYLSDRYPRSPPYVRCMSSVYHPNINESGMVKLHALDSWNPECNRLRDLVVGVEELFEDQRFLTSDFTL